VASTWTQSPPRNPHSRPVLGDGIGADGGAAVEDIVALCATNSDAAKVLDVLVKESAVANPLALEVEEAVVAVLVVGFR
jgi:hypothetical protein